MYYLSIMKRITDKAVERVRQSNRVMAKLMIHYNRGQWSIDKWLRNKDERLIEPAALAILKEELDLDEAQIVEQLETV